MDNSVQHYYQNNDSNIDKKIQLINAFGTILTSAKDVTEKVSLFKIELAKISNETLKLHIESKEIDHNFVKDLNKENKRHERILKVIETRSSNINSAIATGDPEILKMLLDAYSGFEFEKL